MCRLYSYVGPTEIAAKLRDSSPGTPIHSIIDVLQWIRVTGAELDESGTVTATFVVDENGILRLADRRSEHYACAAGGPVQSAGEITFSVTGGNVVVVWITNQSTGYCPEPESWPAVEAALKLAGIAAPCGFSQVMLFRRCRNCGSINIVKDAVFACEVCSLALPPGWNLDVAVALST
jgi:hypothetical protein